MRLVRSLGSFLGVVGALFIRGSFLWIGGGVDFAITELVVAGAAAAGGVLAHVPRACLWLRRCFA